jgi:hypothetical protein
MYILTCMWHHNSIKTYTHTLTTMARAAMASVWIILSMLLLPASSFQGVRLTASPRSRRQFRTTRMASKQELIDSTITSTPQSKRKPVFPLSSYNLARDEKTQKNNFLSFIDYSATPYSQVTRLVEPRAYARSDQFNKNMADVPPTIDDVAPPPHGYGAVGLFLAWNKLPARAVVGTLAYCSFPYILECLSFITRNVESDALLSLVNTWLPGVSIVLGTYVSLTLSILYDRFTRMQETVYKEASILALTCHSLLHLFENDKDAAVEGTQCIADQIRILVRESRGREIMGVIYSDPYARILDLLKKKGNGPSSLDSVSVSVRERSAKVPSLTQFVHSPISIATTF